MDLSNKKVKGVALRSFNKQILKYSESQNFIILKVVLFSRQHMRKLLAIAESGNLCQQSRLWGSTEEADIKSALELPA